MVAWPEATAVARSLSIRRKRVRSRRKLLAPARSRLTRPEPLTAPPAPSWPVNWLTSIALWSRCAANATLVSFSPVALSVNWPAAMVASPRACGSARVPPSVPTACTLPARLRSPPISRSQSGLTSPSAEKSPRIGAVRTSAMRNGAALASAGRTRCAWLASPWLLPSWASMVIAGPVERGVDDPVELRLVRRALLARAGELGLHHPVQARALALQADLGVEPSDEILVQQAEAHAGRDRPSRAAPRRPDARRSWPCRRRRWPAGSATARGRRA